MRVVFSHLSGCYFLITFMISYIDVCHRMYSIFKSSGGRLRRFVQNILTFICQIINRTVGERSILRHDFVLIWMVQSMYRDRQTIFTAWRRGAFWLFLRFWPICCHGASSHFWLALSFSVYLCSVIDSYTENYCMEKSRFRSDNSCWLRSLPRMCLSYSGLRTSAVRISTSTSSIWIFFPDTATSGRNGRCVRYRWLPLISSCSCHSGSSCHCFPIHCVPLALSF